MIYLSGDLRRRLETDTRKAQGFCGYDEWMGLLRRTLLCLNDWPTSWRPAPMETEAENRALDLIRGWPAEMFESDDLLGWVHQAWNGAEKKRINAAGKKIGGRDLLPVTQLWTEDYMAQWCLQNTLGAWWMGKYPGCVMGEAWEYLVLNEDGVPPSIFSGMPRQVADLKIMDPCVGSGVFLLEAFEMLLPMWCDEEEIEGAEAGDAILSKNLFGLDIDNVVLQVCREQLAMLAWKRGGLRMLPPMNLGWSGDPELHPDAPTLGSLLIGNDLTQGRLLSKEYTT